MKPTITPGQGEVMSLIMETLQDEQWLSTGMPAACWAELDDIENLDVLLGVLLTGGVSDEPELVDLLHAMADFGLNNFLIRVRQGDKEAQEYLEMLEDNIMSAADANALHPESMSMIIPRLGEHRWLLSKDFVAFLQHWQSEEYIDQDERLEGPSTPEEMKEALSDMIGMMSDEFMFYQNLRKAHYF